MSMQVTLPNGTTATTAEYSGSGMFSDVHILPDGRAVKVSKHAFADAWLWWAAFCMKYPDASSIAPRIDALRIDVADNSFTAVMERLYPVEGVDTALEGDVADLTERFWDFLPIIPPHLCKDWSFDYGHNFMEDADGETILSDPYCYSGWSDMKCGEDRGYLRDLYGHVIDMNVPNIEFVNIPDDWT